MFGMGTGGSLRLLSPEILCGCWVSLAPDPLRFARSRVDALYSASLFCSLAHLPHLENRTGEVSNPSGLKVASRLPRFKSEI